METIGEIVIFVIIRLNRERFLFGLDDMGSDSETEKKALLFALFLIIQNVFVSELNIPSESVKADGDYQSALSIGLPPVFIEIRGNHSLLLVPSDAQNRLTRKLETALREVLQKSDSTASWSFSLLLSPTYIVNIPGG